MPPIIYVFAEKLKNANTGGSRCIKMAHLSKLVFSSSPDYSLKSPSSRKVITLNKTVISLTHLNSAYGFDSTCISIFSWTRPEGSDSRANKPRQDRATEERRSDLLLKY